MRDRKRYIGSGDVASIIGLCRYRNALHIFNQKLGLEQKNQNNAMKMGLMLEPLVLKLAEDTLNIKIKENQPFFKHDIYDFLGGTADAITECGILLEAKTTRHATDFTNDTIPDNYMIQVQWLLGLSKLKKAFLCVLIGGQDFKTYPIYADENLFSKLINLCVNFWQRHILTMTPPEIEKKINKELPSDTFVIYRRIKELQLKIEEQNKLLGELKEQFDVLTKDEKEITHNGQLLAKKTVSKRETLDKKELAKVIDLEKYITRTEYVTMRFY